MAIYLYTIESTFADDLGIAATPGLALSTLQQRPELGQLSQGVILELRTADQRRQRTHLVNYGVGVQTAPDGSLTMEGDPYLRLTLPNSLTDQDLAPGTEIWWLEDEAPLSEQAIKEMLAPLRPH